MKKLVSILLVCMLAVAMTACGGAPAAEAPAATEAPAAEAATDGTVTNEEYEAAVNPIVTAYSDLIAATNEHLKTYDGSQEWIDAFATAYQQSKDCAEKMGAVKDKVPADYAPSHEKIVLAMNAYNDAYMAMAQMIDSITVGEDANAEAHKAEFTKMFLSAEELWNSAVE